MPMKILRTLGASLQALAGALEGVPAISGRVALHLWQNPCCGATRMPHRGQK
jgi:hypothetical protein